MAKSDPYKDSSMKLNPKEKASKPKARPRKVIVKFRPGNDLATKV